MTVGRLDQLFDKVNPAGLKDGARRGTNIPGKQSAQLTRTESKPLCESLDVWILDAPLSSSS